MNKSSDSQNMSTRELGSVAVFVPLDTWASPQIENFKVRNHILLIFISSASSTGWHNK